MTIDNNNYTQNIQNFRKEDIDTDNNKEVSKTENETNNRNDKKELSVEEQIQKSAVEVSLSMNAQVILFTMDTQDLTMHNSEAQKSILDFLAGKNVENQLSLSDIGYEGKPITELTKDEAKELISPKGFFGISETSQRVADFVFAFSDNDLNILEKSRAGIVEGFKETEKLWGEELPKISYQTQAQTLKIIDAKIEEIKKQKELEIEKFEDKQEEQKEKIKEFEKEQEERKEESKEINDKIK